MNCCNNCFAAGSFGSCFNCGCVHYCSSSCQRIDWKNHKPFCSHFSDKSKNNYLTKHFAKNWRNQWKKYIYHLLLNFPRLPPADLMSKISQLPPDIDKIVLKITEIVSNAFAPLDASEKECDSLPEAALLLRATKRKRLPPVRINSNPDDGCYKELLYRYRNNDENTGTRLYYAPFPEMSFSIVFMCLRMTDDEYYCQWTKDFGFAGPVLMFATYQDEDGKHLASTSVPLDQSILDDDCMLLLGILTRFYLEGETCTCTKCDDEWKRHLFGANRHTVSPKNHCHACHDLVIRDDDHPLWKCGKCKNAYYCSKECQETDWPNHRGSCIRVPITVY